MNVTYHVCTGAVKSEDGTIRTIYGIEMKRGGITAQIARDVFTDAAECEALAAICNRLELSDVHFDDVIQDAVQK